LESCLDQPEESSIHEVIRYGPSPLPARHYDPDTTEPTSCGLHSMEELLSWRRSEANPFNVASVPLAPREPSLGSCQRRTLVSHDMMGGYLDDFIQGTNAETPYAFYHWCYIDIFNYFTHQLVSIPPVQWTNAAHKHGVIVLTFITEWTDGATKCEAFLKDKESYRSVADKLVQISQCYGFDGWLINIENPLSEAAVSNAPLFLQYLTEQMHERVPSSLVLWYDSVIQSGELKWQNELNQSNMFFDSCDGFFTNYNWTEQSLESMKDYSGVQGRQADVYVGVDVFARGEVVGGMLETNKALDLIRKHNFSAAIFAPGWVYESLEDKTEFRQKQDFWALLSEYLYVHRPATPLPFASSFCQGFGEALYWSGQLQKEKTSSWFNLSAQDPQPLYLQRDLEGGGWLRRSGCPLDAWSGGSSLLLDGLIPANLSAAVCACILRDVGMLIQRDGEPGDVPFSCRLGKIMLLNATLRWEYSSELVHHFKVHRRRLRGPDPRIPPGPLELVGRAHANLFRVTALAVPEPPSLLELVVEPVLLVDVPVPEELWGRRQLSY
uniref:Cytosolic endo-beta-N-acetylglucosaminidase n=1 Tax=Oryzias latipes TaxID=8090 RepID=A0A3P9L8J1_ORYLA